MKIVSEFEKKPCAEALADVWMEQTSLPSRGGKLEKARIEIRDIYAVSLRLRTCNK